MSATHKKLTAAGLTLLAVAVSESSETQAMTVGAYAVANHSNCGAGNIPGTIAELDKFFASADLPTELQRNFYWKDARVKQTDWIKESDYRASTDAATGFDGADASLLTYIASHGVTSSGVYKALAGSRNNGGCYIPTSSLELGNHTSRYTILSTCQGLKIGTGDNPTANGENPSRTWKNAAKGLNCIFGYSNNMADADEYGEYLLSNIKDGTTPLSKAFMDASESVSTDNIPAVMCYGSNEQDAADYIENNTAFETQARPNTASAWVYRVVQSSQESSSVKAQIPAALKLTPLRLNMEKIAKLFLGNSVTKSQSGRSVSFNSNAGSASFDAKTGTISIRNNLVDDIRNESVPSLAESEQIARHALKLSGLLKAASSLSLAATATDVLGGENNVFRVSAFKFTFKQNLSGAQPLSQQGSVDVTVGAGGTITAIKAALVQIDPSFRPASRPTDISSRGVDIDSLAIKHVESKAPGANYRVIKKRVGFDAGNFMKAKSVAPAVVEVTVEASQGGFTRNFIEKIAL